MQQTREQEAVAYDPVKDVFWVSGGFNPDIFEISRSGQILNVINVLKQYPNPSLVGTAQGVYLKGLELAPSSDGSGHYSACGSRIMAATNIPTAA